MACISDDAAPAMIVRSLTHRTLRNHDSGMVCISDDTPRIQTVHSSSYSYSAGQQMVFKTAQLKLPLKPNASTESKLVQTKDHDAGTETESNTSETNDDLKRAQKRRRVSSSAYQVYY